MLHHNSQSEKLEQRFSTLFSVLRIGLLLRQVGIRKSFGMSSLAIFELLFTLVFQGRNWYRLLDSQRRNDLPGKDVVYRFLNHSRFAWRQFLHALSFKVVRQFESLTSASRIRTFIIDDSVLRRDRSKKAELLARVHDHTTGRFVRGYTMLTLGWSDGYSFAPIDFMMLSSAKLANRLSEMKEKLDKRMHGYKRRLEAFSRKPYVLMDSWFTQAPLLRELIAKGLHIIGMVKEMKQRYIFEGKRMTLQELYRTLNQSAKAEILGYVIAKTACGMPIKIVFVQNRNRRREWLAVLSTDLTLTANEIIRIYGMRWSIGVSS